MKLYTRPEIEISVFAAEDIITTSADPIAPTPAVLMNPDDATTLTNKTTDSSSYDSIFNI